ncbi:MAG: hypothetical protein QM667_11990 [Asticcacaulis sp.]
MRGWILLSCCVALLTGSAVHAQTPAPSKAAEKAARWEQSLAELDSPSPLERLAVFQEIMAGTDTTLKKLAAQKVLSGGDKELKNEAIFYAISQTRTYSFSITNCVLTPNALQHSCTNLLQTTNGNLLLIFAQANPQTKEFVAFSNYSSIRNNQKIAHPGRLNDYGLTFGVNLEQAYGQNPVNGCAAKFTKLESTRYIGTITCPYQTLSGFFELY